jgi:hypothetical protein
MALAMAGLLSLTALATFTFIIGRPTPYRGADPSELRSPIESVIERLNQTISPDSAESAGRSAAELASANADQPETHSRSIPAVVPLSPLVSANSEPSRPHEHNPSTTHSGEPLSRAAAASPSTTQGQPRTILPVPQSAVPPEMRTSVPASVLANLPTKLTRSFQAVAGDPDLPQWFVLQQNGGRLTGTGGTASAGPYLALRGSASNDSVTFEFNDQKTEYLYNLRFAGNELRGTLSIKSENKTRVVKVRFERVE